MFIETIFQLLILIFESVICRCSAMEADLIQLKMKIRIMLFIILISAFFILTVVHVLLGEKRIVCQREDLIIHYDRLTEFIHQKRKMVYIDVFCCAKDFMPYECADIIRKTFQAQKAEWRVIPR